VTSVLVTGAGGFIGHHLVTHLRTNGDSVRGADLKPPAFAPSQADEFMVTDLRDPSNCRAATEGIDEVYHLAANMGGIGYISSSLSEVAHDNVLIDANVLEAAHRNSVGRLFYASSACIYPVTKQQDAATTSLREEDAHPAAPEEGYGWEKLFGEKLCGYYTAEGRLDTRVARFHNVFGPLGVFEGGREKAPAALCRKVALARDGDEIEIWGDGEQTRSFMYIEDCIEGMTRLMRTGYRSPLNLGRSELVSVNELVDLILKVAGKRLTRRYDPTKPQGVRGRNSDNERLRSVLGWEPQVSLAAGLAETYRWIEAQIAIQSAT
jgi:nucleoside-diphosphate-sugar epimerase